MELEGKVALVTGGGRGIGRGIVDCFLMEGARVAVVQRQPLDPELAKHPEVAWIEADLTATSAIPDIVRKVVNQFSHVDILVNNAGIMFERSVSEMRPEEWDMMISLNLKAPLFLTQAVVPHMRRRGGGSIINIGSIEGLAANPEHAAYCASKAGLHGMTKALALDLGAANIRCNAIAPGWITSELSETYLDAQDNPPAARKALHALHPAGRLGDPKDVGNLSVYLSSDKAGFLTGEVIILDGGRTAKLPLPF